MTSPTLSFDGDVCTVVFQATNNTGRRVSASLRVTAGLGTPAGGYTPPAYVEFARSTISVSLDRRESKSLSCEFPVKARRPPNTARVEIASTNNGIDHH